MTDRHHLKGLSLDTEFGSIDPREGHVNLVVQGSNVPGINRLLQLTPPASSPVASSSRCHSRFFKRGFFGEIGSAIGNTAGDTGDTTSDVGNAVGDAFNNFNSFDKNVTKTLIPSISTGISKFSALTSHVLLRKDPKNQNSGRISKLILIRRPERPLRLELWFKVVSFLPRLKILEFSQVCGNRELTL